MTQEIRDVIGDGRYERMLQVEDGAEAFVEALVANAVQYVFIAPGTDTIPIQEAIARLRSRGRATPSVILCLHEAVTMSAAHGHFMVSGRPQVAMVHVDVGTQNVGGALHNAFKGQAGVVFCAGATPFTTDGELRGGRTKAHHWIQEPMDQAGLVRENVKWLYHLRTAENVGSVVQRAFQVAGTEPCGPSYLMLPRELLMSRVAKAGILSPARCAPPITPAGDPTGLAEVAEMLVRSEHPLIITNTTGRHPSAVQSLVELVDLLAVPVVETRSCMNLPTDHPMHGGFSPYPYFKEADLVVCLDHAVPYAPLLGQPRSDAKIVRLAIDPAEQTFPLWVFPADLALVADTSKALPIITSAARDMLRDADRVRIEARRSRVAAAHAAMRERFDRLALDNATRVPIHSGWVARCVNEVFGDDALFVQEVVTQVDDLCQQIRTTKPGTLFSNSGGSLGWGMGAALGAKLAAPHNDVVCLVGDGVFNFSEPLAVLWAAEAYDAPFLTVIFNNASYYAVQRALAAEYPEGFGARRDADVGHQITPSPHYELVGKACRAYAETVSDPTEVRPALERARAEIRAGRAAVLDILVGQT